MRAWFAAAPVALVAVVAVGACSIPSVKQYVPGDGPSGAPFGCYNQPLPTTAPPQVVIAGSVADPYTDNPVAGASIQAFLSSAPTSPIFTVTAGSDGSFVQDQGTGGVPRDIFMHATNNGFEDTLFYPAVPVVADTQFEVQLLTTSQLLSLAGVAGVTLDAAKTQIVISVVDCNGSPVAGATVSTSPGGTVRYLVDQTPSMTATSTDATTGSALVFNVAPGTTTIDAMSGTMTLRSHDLTSTAGTVTQTEIQP